MTREGFLPPKQLFQAWAIVFASGSLACSWRYHDTVNCNKKLLINPFETHVKRSR